MIWQQNLIARTYSLLINFLYTEHVYSTHKEDRKTNEM